MLSRAPAYGCYVAEVAPFECGWSFGFLPDEYKINCLFFR